MGAAQPREVNPFGPASKRARPPAEQPPAPVPPKRSLALPVRGLTGFEEEFIEAHAAEANTATLCNEVLARCLVPPGQDPGEARQRVRGLIVAERDRALVELRKRSLGPTVQSVASCPSCSKVNEVKFSLDDLPLDFVAPTGNLILTLDDGTPVELRLPTAGDQEELLDAGLTSAAERRTWLLATTLVRYGEARGPFDLNAARGLPLAARRQMEAAVDAALPDLDFRMSTACAFCGAEFAAPFDIPAFFLGS